MARRLYALARLALARRRRVVAGWLLVLVVVGVLGIAWKGTFSSEFTVPGIESQNAQNLLQHKFRSIAGGVARVVFAAPRGSTLTSPSAARSIDTALQIAAKGPDVVAVANPFATGTLSADKTIGYADVLFRPLASDVSDTAKQQLQDAMAPARRAGLDVQFGGTAYNGLSKSNGPGEAIGVVVAFVVLSIALGSLVAAGLPLATAFLGVGASVLTIGFLARFFSVTNTATTLATMIGLAVGIDYALFIVSRHREQLRDPNQDVDDSIGRAVATAGSAVVFAATTVIIALSALAAAGIPFLTVMGLAAAGTVLLALLLALTLIPALLGFAGEKLRPRASRRASKQPGAWGRAWGRGISRAPFAVLAICVVGLVVLALPTRDLRLGLPSNATQHTSSTQHKSYVLLTRGFGPGFNATLEVVVYATDIPPNQRSGVLTTLAATLRQDPDIAVVAPPTANPLHTVAVVNVVPKTPPDAEATTRLVDRMRTHDTGAVVRAGGTQYVAGNTATDIDVSSKLGGAMPLFISIIVVLAFLLLMIAFRSLLVPLVAVLGFLLSIAASLGLVVWVFQLGHLDGVLGVVATAPIVSFVPVLLVGVLFGLAMDYEVFLVSRMRESFDEHGHAVAAVTGGVERSGRVVCAAALIMSSVFAGFIITSDPIVKAIAFALTMGVLLDAFVVRMTVVPAVMMTLGRHAWWLPRWLDRLLPDVDIEGTRLPARVPDTIAEPRPDDRVHESGSLNTVR
jgi:uncharacterized membrane protein YdfJ with MMPL/SSD domain